MKTIKQLINEANIDVPLDEIIDSSGRVMAHLPMFNDPKDYPKHSYFEFTFRNAKQKKEFQDTTMSREFWLELYGYDSVGVEENNWNEIQKEMSKFGNCIVGNKLVVYCLDEIYTSEMFERCDQIDNQYDFKETNKHMI